MEFSSPCCFAGGEISIYALYAVERVETAREDSILHPERIVGNPEVTGANTRDAAKTARSPVNGWVGGRLVRYNDAIIHTPHTMMGSQQE
jgi:hypothetical protein